LTKTEIIARTLRDLRPIWAQGGITISAEPEDEEFVAFVLRDVLPEEVDILSCEDFQHLHLPCCDTCHNFYPHDNMSLIVLPDGSKAWVCDEIKWAIYPERHRGMMDSAAGKLLSQIFGMEVEEQITTPDRP
jgi:hypothetical protein